MATQAFVSPAQYLAMSFDGLDREYVDGELKERGMPTYLHARIQARLCELFGKLGEQFPVFAAPELRLSLDANRLYRIPDLSVFAGAEPREPIPSHPPLIAIEIVSPDDRLSDTLQKFEEYRNWGIRHIWMVDPQAKRLFVYDGHGLHGVDQLELPEFAFVIRPADLKVPDWP